jgi:hypothetical protein
MPMLRLLTLTWEGVCSFSYQISSSAEKSLNQSPTSTICFIEILKELVSNASRHGGATKFWLNAYLNPEGDLEMIAGNNGKPVPSDITHQGLGNRSKGCGLLGHTSHAANSYFFLNPDGHFGLTAVTVLVLVPFTQVMVVCFLNPAGQVGFTPVTFLTWEPLAQLIVVCFCVALGVGVEACFKFSVPRLITKSGPVD